jgi:hypothetical protein
VHPTQAKDFKVDARVCANRKRCGFQAFSSLDN